MYLLMGQIMCACGMAFLDIAAPKLSANWFPAKERTLATAIAAGKFLKRHKQKDHKIQFGV